MSETEGSVLTQAEVDAGFIEIKQYWDKKVAESGQSEQMFIATDRTGFVAQFLTNYEEARLGVEAQGLTMPVLVKGLKVTIDSSDDEYNEVELEIEEQDQESLRL
jgi:hypothetical protein